MDHRDISYVLGSEKFNYRVCAVIVHEGRVLAMRDERSPYFYLPGGRVRLGETAEAALLRELREELYIAAKLLRPLWLNQSFHPTEIGGTAAILAGIAILTVAKEKDNNYIKEDMGNECKGS